MNYQSVHITYFSNSKYKLSDSKEFDKKLANTWELTRKKEFSKIFKIPKTRSIVFVSTQEKG